VDGTPFILETELISKDLGTLDLPFEARYNIAPSQSVLSLGNLAGGLEARRLAWGLIPSWSADGARSCFCSGKHIVSMAIE
jgi:putative SOS response-associated peptidase YedK